nr:required for respiratory growth protein 9, mitochondrial [Quercus suber]
MAHCTCSTHVLKLFVEQIAGINIGRRNLASTSFRNRKPPGSRSFIRSVCATRDRIANETHAPLKSPNAQETSTTRHGDDVVKQKGATLENNYDGWHTNAATKASAKDMSTADRSPLLSGSETVGGSRESLQRRSKTTVDAVQLRGLRVLASTSHSDESLTLSPPDPSKQTANCTSSESQRTISRKLRKTRRVEEGRYRPRAQEVQPQKSSDEQASLVTDSRMVKQPESQNQEGEITRIKTPTETFGPKDDVSSVLDMIKNLEGPEFQLEQPKAVHQKSSKAAEKIKGGKTIKKKAVFKEEASRTKREMQKEPWQVQKAALERKFGDAGWNPRKRLSPDTLEGIRAIHVSDPATYTTETLSEHFKITPEAVRRILKSKWKASEDEETDRRARWQRRGVKKWEALASLGVRPPVKWRAMGVGSENGIKSDRVPKRNLKRRGDESGELSWDEVVADLDDSGGVAARIL